MKRECWDAKRMSAVFPSRGYIQWSSHGVDPYKFVYDGWIKLKCIERRT